MIKKISILFLTISMMLFSSCVAISSDFFDDHHTLTVSNSSSTTVNRSIKHHDDYIVRNTTIPPHSHVEFYLPEGKYKVYINGSNGSVYETIELEQHETVYY